MKSTKSIKGLLFGATVLGGMVAVGASGHEVDASTWVANSTAQIQQQMNQQKHNGQLVVYIVQKGDTLSGISQASGVSMNQILTMNDIANPNLIHVGQKINLGKGEKARAFVEQKGQSVKENAKGYKAPSSVKAQKAIANSATHKGGNATKAPVASTNVAKPNVSKPTYKPVQNTNGTGTTNNGGGIINNDGTTNPVKPSTGGNTGNGNTANNGGQTNNGGGIINNDGTTNPVKPSKPSTGGNTGNGGGIINNDGTTNPVKPSKPSTGGNTGNGGNTTPSKPVTPNKPVTPSKPSNPQDSLNANEINKGYQQAITNSGWKGQWVSNNDGYWDTMDSESGQASASTWQGDKNPNKTLAQNSANATVQEFKNNGNDVNNYKYGYSHTTTIKGETASSSKTDYYFWN